MYRISSALIITVFMATTALAGWSPLGPYGGVITSVTTSKDGVYVGTEGGGLFFSKDNGRNWEGRSEGLEDLFVESLATGPGNTLYAGTRDGVYKSSDGKRWAAVASIPRGLTVRDLAVDDGGKLLASVWGSGLYICGGNDACSNPRKQLSSLHINDILPLKNGDIVVATEGGIFFKSSDNEEWKLLGLIENLVSAVALNGRDVIYAAAWGTGVHYLKDGDWRMAPGTGSSMAAALKRGPDNNLYVGTEEGMAVLPVDSTDWKHLGLRGIYVKAMGFGPGGELYAGSYGRGFYVKEKDGSWDGRNTGICNSNIITAATAEDGTLFAGTKQGLYIRPAGSAKWNEVAELYGMKVHAILFLENKVYTGTSNGLFVGSSSEKGWKRVPGEIGYLPVTALTAAGSVMFAGTDTDGIFKGRPGKGEWMRPNEGLENLRIRALSMDDNGNLYAGTYQGIFILEKGKDAWSRAGLQEHVILSMSVNDGVIYAAAENKGIFSGRDGKWTMMDAPLPNKRILSIFLSGKKIYASGYGWVISREGEGPWKEITGGLSSTVIQFITMDKAGKLYAGTWGSGMWRMD